MTNDSVSECALLSPKVDQGQIWIRRAVTLWVILAVAVGVKAFVQPDRHTLFPCFAGASLNWWNDESLYDSPSKTTGFRYSPTFAIAFTPFAVFPNTLGTILWTGFNIAALLWSLHVLVRDVLPGDWTKWREALFLGLSLVGSVRSIWSGQSNALIFALAAFSIAAIAKKRWWTAACLLAAGLFVKLWPLALALLLIACFPRPLIPRFSAAAAGLALFPFLTRPFSVVLSQYVNWYTLLTGPYRTLRQAGYRDAATIWENLHGPIHPPTYLGLQLATAAGVLAWCIWLRKRSSSVGHHLTAVMAMWICWQLLFGPGTERLTFAIVAPLVSWAVIESFSQQRLRTLSIAAWSLTGILGAGAIERLLLPYFPASPSILPIGAIVFVVWQVLHFGVTRKASGIEDVVPRQWSSENSTDISRQAA